MPDQGRTLVLVVGRTREGVGGVPKGTRYKDKKLVIISRRLSRQGGINHLTVSSLKPSGSSLRKRAFPQPMKDGVVSPAMNTARIDIVPKEPGTSMSHDGLRGEGSDPGLLKGRITLATRSDRYLNDVITQTMGNTPAGSSISFQHPK
eukprot:1035144-Pyramimonas_sp.AAC.1